MWLTKQYDVDAKPVSAAICAIVLSFSAKVLLREDKER